MARARNPPQPLTLGLFERTGRQDCGNAFDANDFNDIIRRDRKAGKSRTARQVVDDTWKEWEEGGEFEAQWIDQQSGDFEGLDPHECFEAWGQGWRACAVRQVQDLIDEMEEREMIEGNPKRKNPTATDLEADITEGMARAIWVTSYADFIEELAPAERREHGFGTLSGVNWSTAAPDTPKTAYDAAAQLEDLFYRANTRTMSGLLELAMAADGKSKASIRYAELFGHYMAMQALDNGVSWFDDHKRFVVTFPKFEAHTFDGESVDWSPMSQKNPGRRKARR